MVSFQGNVNFYTKIVNPNYSALTMQNYYQPSNYYDTAEKLPQELQDSFQHGVSQLQELANQTQPSEDINVRVVQDEVVDRYRNRFLRTIGFELDLRKPNLEESTFKAGNIWDLQNVFENFVYEVQNKMTVEAQNQHPQQGQVYDPFGYNQPPSGQNHSQQTNQQYQNPFQPIQMTDAFKEETLYDNMTPDGLQQEDAGNAQGIPFSFAPQEDYNHSKQGGYEGDNDPYSYSPNPVIEQDYTHDSSYDFNQNFDPGTVLI